MKLYHFFALLYLSGIVSGANTNPLTSLVLTVPESVTGPMETISVNDTDLLAAIQQLKHFYSPSNLETVAVPQIEWSKSTDPSEVYSSFILDFSRGKILSAEKGKGTSPPSSTPSSNENAKETDAESQPSTYFNVQFILNEYFCEAAGCLDGCYFHRVTCQATLQYQAEPANETRLLTIACTKNQEPLHDYEFIDHPWLQHRAWDVIAEEIKKRIKEKKEEEEEEEGKSELQLKRMNCRTGITTTTEPQDEQQLKQKAKSEKNSSLKQEQVDLQADQLRQPIAVDDPDLLAALERLKNWYRPAIDRGSGRNSTTDSQHLPWSSLVFQLESATLLYAEKDAALQLYEVLFQMKENVCKGGSGSQDEAETQQKCFYYLDTCKVAFWHGPAIWRTSLESISCNKDQTEHPLV